jgi:hypothetical protein
MAFGTYLRFNQTADIYQKITTVSPAGQKTFEYSLIKTIPIFVQSHSSETSNTGKRIAPYQDYIAVHQIIVPSDYTRYIDYTNRIQVIKDKYGEILEVGPFEIISIQPKFGFNGRKAHLLAVIRKIMEPS